MNRSMLAAMLAIGLGTATNAEALTILSGPSFTAASAAPLAGTLNLTTDVPSRVSVFVSDGMENWERDFYDYGTSHYVPLFGFKPARTNSITVTVWDRFRNVLTAPAPVVFVTDPLPADFPTINVLVSEPERMEPGYTLFRVLNATANVPYTILVDNTGEVVWYGSLDQVPTGIDVRLLPDGNLFMFGSTNFSEVNLLGEVVNTWTVPDNLSIDEHDGVPTGHNTILYINDYSQVVAGFPTSATIPTAPTGTATVAANAIIEMSATNNALLNNWSLFDMLDPVRVSYLTFTTLDSLGVDWGHANAVIEDPSDDSIIASLRHQNAVVKFSRATGQLVWILGPPQNWGPEWQQYLLTPVGTPFEWNYGQHAPTLTPQGTLLLYDDGNYRASPFDPPVPDSSNYSRAVEYDINEQMMEVTQVWQYGENVPEPLFTPFLGSADWQTNTGNVLVNFGAVTYVNYLPPSTNAPGAMMVRVQEVTHDANPEVVFDLSIFDYNNPSSGYLGYWAYRSHRVPDLYAHPAMPVSDLNIQYSDGVALLEFSGDPARTYVIQASADLEDWSELGTAQGEGGLYDFYDAEPENAGPRFYRVQTQ
ncbi:MAG: aryl-sulfate sulfotransferase [Limisphaerales bacterium]